MAEACVIYLIITTLTRKFDFVTKLAIKMNIMPLNGLKVKPIV